MELSKQVVVLKETSESPLMALLALYKLHSPHLVPMGNPPGRKVTLRECILVLLQYWERGMYLNNEVAISFPSFTDTHYVGLV